jgi:3-deoxy-manno-octulosonate cytidylyltransferase (CMP-KDO synthetase)
MIQHVYEAAARANHVSRVIVACDEERIVDAVSAFGGEAVLTSQDHPNGSSRIAEACRTIGLAPSDVVVNVQGDEPEIEPGVIDACVDALVNDPNGAHVATIASPFRAGEDVGDPNIVKVVRRRDGHALYFTRARIPFERADAGASAPALKHIGIYAYRRMVLEHYADLQPTPLERTEQLEQLRFLEHGYRIAVGLRDVRATGIDTPEEYEAFVARWNSANRPG